MNSAGERVHREDDVNVNAWIEAIDDRDGWKERHLGTSLGDALSLHLDSAELEEVED